MGVKFGEIDINQVLDNEYKIKVIEKILGWILNNNNSLNKPSQENIVEIRKSVVEDLKQKYPHSNIKLRS